MSEAGLKPCPFCGGRAELTEDRYACSCAPFKVECRNCGANRTDYERGDCIAAWNSRVLKVGQGDCVKCADEPDESCPYYGEPNGCNRRSLAEIARKVAAR